MASDIDTQTGILTAVQVMDPGDPAFNRALPNAQELLLTYARTRSPADREALSALVRPGKTPAQFELSPLPFAALLYAQEASSPMAQQDRAFRASCFAVVDAAGVRHEAKLVTASGAEFPLASAAWSAEVAKLCGANAVREMGAVALRRAEVTADAVDPYWPLRGAPPLAL